MNIFSVDGEQHRGGKQAAGQNTQKQISHNAMNDWSSHTFRPFDFANIELVTWSLRGWATRSRSSVAAIVSWNCEQRIKLLRKKNFGIPKWHADAVSNWDKRVQPHARRESNLQELANSYCNGRLL
jgi:hypothetical protein